MLSSVILFLNIGTPELILIMFVALLLFGGEKLPGLARGLGKGIRDFKDASEGVKREINNQIYNYEEKKEEEQAKLPEEGTADEAPADEVKPLIDVTPVSGTVPLGGPQHEADEKHTEQTPVDEPAKAEKATHE